MNVCTYSPVKIWDEKGINARFSTLFKQSCFLSNKVEGGFQNVTIPPAGDYTMTNTDNIIILSNLVSDNTLTLLNPILVKGKTVTIKSGNYNTSLVPSIVQPNNTSGDTLGSNLVIVLFSDGINWQSNVNLK